MAAAHIAIPLRAPEALAATSPVKTSSPLGAFRVR